MLKDAILADYEGMLLRVPPHNEEHAKAMKASQARIEVLKKKLGENAQEKSRAEKDPHMKFRSPEAQAQQEKIEKLAEVYRNTKNPQVLAALKKEVTKQGCRRNCRHVCKDHKNGTGCGQTPEAS